MKLERKQKILIPIIVIVFLYIAWQLYDMFGGSISSSSSSSSSSIAQAPRQAQTDSSASEASANSSGNADESAATRVQNEIGDTIQSDDQSLDVNPKDQLPDAQATGSAQNNAGSLKQTQGQTTAVDNGQTRSTTNQNAGDSRAAQASSQGMPNLNPQQQEYLRLLNEYQLLKLQRQIVDEKAQIATAQEKIAEVNLKAKSTGDAYLSQFSNQSQSGGQYRLLYLDNQSGQWTATLSQGGQYYEVSSGDVLPDGSRILSVNRTGVEMIYKQQRYRLDFYGMKPDEDTAQPQPAAAHGSDHEQKTAAELLMPQLKNKHQQSSAASGNDEAARAEVKKTPYTVAPSAVANSETPASVSKQEKLVPLNRKQTKELVTLKQFAPKTSAADSQRAQARQASNKTAKPVSNTDGQQLKSQGYAIQIMAARQSKDLDMLIKKYQLKQQATIAEINSGNKPMYILLYGHYQKATDADQTISQLPKALQKLEPWIRPLSSVNNATVKG